MIPFLRVFLVAHDTPMSMDTDPPGMKIALHTHVILTYGYLWIPLNEGFKPLSSAPGSVDVLRWLDHAPVVWRQT